MLGCESKKGSVCEPSDPVLVWPFTQETQIAETMTNTFNGAVGSINYGICNGNGLDTAIEFSGETGSFVMLQVPNNTAFLGDYTIQFYLQAYSSTSEMLIQYKSVFQTADDDIEEWKLYLVNGDINVIINNVNISQVIFDTNIIENNWVHVMLERDISKDTIKIFLNRKEIAEKGIDTNLMDKPTVSPGILYLGQDMYQQYNFHGMVSCLQIIPCKETVALDYDNFCNIVNGTHVQRSTSTSTSTTSSGTSQSTVTPSISTPSTLSSTDPSSSSTPSTLSSTDPSSSLSPTLPSTVPALHSTVPPVPITGSPSK